MGQISDRDQAVQQALDRDPSLATLFGSQDYCATDDCTSVLSPAAYLCDLLMWLRNHLQGTQTALDVLDSRRPDIRHLLLNCPNADTELPYIDLVNELLADKISPAMDSATTSYVQAALAKDFVAVKVNVEGSKENRELAIQLNTEAIPHIVFFDSSGKKLSEIVGFVPADQFRDELRKAVEIAAKK